MASKTKLSVLLIFVCISVLCVTSLSRSNFRAKYVNSQDPQQKYQQCKQSCQQEELSKKEQKQCVQSCKEKRQQQEQQQYEQCRQECQQKEQGEEQQQCQKQCEKQCGSNPYNEESEEQQQEEENNPFFFDEDCFKDQFKTKEGFARVLQKFSEKSDLLRGVDDYRLAYLEANPNTFVLPKHRDAEAFMLVRKGSGTINLVYQNRRESYVIERGHVIRVPAGAVVYYSNDNKEKLKVVTLFKPISVPSEVEDFFGAGGEDPRSFYRSFSEDIIQAAFNIEMKDAERLFKKHSEGEVVKANEEQIKALRERASSSSHSQGQGETRKPYNLFNKEPTYSNEYGQLYDVDGNDFKQLQYSDISVSYANISKGGMFAPVYNTDSTRIIFVAKGKGRYELICPHLARQSQSHEERGEEERYKRVSANLRRGTANVVLAGHPFSVVASEKQNLHLVIFGINAKNNQRVFLAGKQNWMKNLDGVAKQLSFSTPAKEVDQLLEKQTLAHFLPGPSLRQQGGRQARLASILGFNGF